MNTGTTTRGDFNSERDILLSAPSPPHDWQLSRVDLRNSPGEISLPSSQTDLGDNSDGRNVTYATPVAPVLPLDTAKATSPPERADDIEPDSIVSGGSEFRLIGVPVSRGRSNRALQRGRSVSGSQPG